ncbi:TlpA disulfide reductase family protein [Nocardioides sp. ChNu-99]|uniref:TlpA family protein disulfide reductase n=1 Tax=Nocardioides sp. ChNu-99 TaxID=2839897 RepID=UPI00240534CE|nr:TlpA disulfide reductase family protein [Nocardioides sp. ChNu-99]MDF9716736.1 TlpA family protein disulfide reductase [Nocardioides sp. ChNu-99]
MVHRTTRARRVRSLTVALATALLLTLTACAGESESTGNSGYITGDGQITLVDPADRGEPITLEGEGLDGEPLSLAAERGRPVVVNVWGSWCPPCRAEAPELVEAAERLDGTAAFLGINSRDSSPAQAQSFERTFDVPYPSIYSSDGRALLAFADTIPARTIPATLVLDAEGRVAASIVGQVTSAGTLVGIVEDLVVEAGGTLPTEEPSTAPSTAGASGG